MEFKEKLAFIWQYARPYKKRLVFFLSAVVIMAGLNLTTPFLFGRITDVVIGRAEFFNLVWWQIALLTAGVLIALSYCSHRLRLLAANNDDTLHRDFIMDMCQTVVRFVVRHYHLQKTGATQSAIGRSSGSLPDVIHMIIIDFLPGILAMTGALIWVFYLNWILGSIMLFNVVLYFLISQYYKISGIMVCQEELNQRMDSTFGNINDMLANFFAVKTNTAEKHEIALRQAEFAEILPKSFKINRLWFDYNLAQAIVQTCNQILVMVISIYFLKIGKISEGELLAFILYTRYVNNPMEMINHNIRRLRSYLVNVEEARKLKQEEQETDLPEAQDVELQGKIEFCDVSFSYNGDDDGVLKDINLVIPAGKVLAIMGQTGVGKSTLTSLLLRLFDPKKGRILFDGIDARQITRESLRSQIAVVPQDPILFHASLLDNIRYGRPEATMEEVISAVKIANAHDFIMAKPNGYDSVVGERGVMLSGGQKQRIAIARAALRNPKILILDEATKDLDIETKAEVLAALKNVISNRTVIVITHDFSAITKSADQIIVLQQGKIVQQGRHNELVQQEGIYLNYWQKLQQTLGF